MSKKSSVVVLGPDTFNGDTPAVQVVLSNPDFVSSLTHGPTLKELLSADAKEINHDNLSTHH